MCAKLWKNINIVPGVHCKKYCEVTNQKNKSLISYKKRRFQLKNKTLSSKAKKEEKEGTTYQTGIGLNLDITHSNGLLAELSTLIRSLTTSQLTEYEKLVPPFTSRPTHPHVSYQSTINYEFIVFLH